jgi:hypothetical protein
VTYRPFAQSESQRSYAYKYVWFGAACSVALLPVYLLGVHGPYGLIFGGAVGGLFASAITGRTDDYFRSLCTVGHRWVMVALSLYMFAGFTLYLFGDATPPGRGVLSGSTQPPAVGSMALFYDGHLAAIVLTIIYHAGYGYQWIRDRIGSDDES